MPRPARARRRLSAIALLGAALASATEAACAADGSCAEPSAADVDRLTRQYSALPYPDRGVAQFSAKSGLNLNELGAYLFGGRRDVWRRPGLRILDAGGGTGDAVLTLAWQLAAANLSDFEIVHLDLSAASQERCRARAAHFGYAERITFVSGSLLDLDPATHGSFDLIMCQ